MPDRSLSELLQDETFVRAVDKLLDRRMVDDPDFSRDLEKLIDTKIMDNSEFDQKIDRTIRDQIMESEDFKDLLKKHIDKSLSENIDANVENKYTKVLANILSFFGLKTTPRFSIVIVPIVVSLATVILYDRYIQTTTTADPSQEKIDTLSKSIADLDERLGSQQTDSAKLLGEIAEVKDRTDAHQNIIDNYSDLTNRNTDKIATILSNLHNMPDGFWIHSIKFSRLNTRRFWLPIQCDFNVKMRIFLPEGVSSDSVENELVFRINKQVIKSVGESEFHKNWTNTFVFTDSLNEIAGANDVFDKSGQQLFEFQALAVNSDDDQGPAPEGQLTPEELRDLEIQVLVYVQRPILREIEAAENEHTPPSANTECAV